MSRRNSVSGISENIGANPADMSTLASVRKLSLSPRHQEPRAARHNFRPYSPAIAGPILQPVKDVDKNASGVSKFRGNVRLSVQRKCHSVRPGWYQMTAWQQQPPGFVALEGLWHPCISLWWLCGFPIPARCPKRHPLATGFLNRLPSLLLKERRFARRGGCGLASCGHVVSDHTATVLALRP